MTMVSGKQKIKEGFLPTKVKETSVGPVSGHITATGYYSRGSEADFLGVTGFQTG